MEIFLLAGSTTLFLITGIVLMYKNIKFVEGATKTMGEIVEINEYNGNNGGRNITMYNSIIEFSTFNNTKVRFQDASSSNWKPKMGAKKALYYYEDKPENAKVASIFVLFVVPPILIALGILLVVVTVMVAGS